MRTSRLAGRGRGERAASLRHPSKRKRRSSSADSSKSNSPDVLRGRGALLRSLARIVGVVRGRAVGPGRWIAITAPIPFERSRRDRRAQPVAALPSFRPNGSGSAFRSRPTAQKSAPRTGGWVARVPTRCVTPVRCERGRVGEIRLSTFEVKTPRLIQHRAGCRAAGAAPHPPCPTRNSPAPPRSPSAGREPAPGRSAKDSSRRRPGPG